MREHAFRYGATLAGFVVGLLLFVVLDGHRLGSGPFLAVLVIVLVVAIVATLPAYVIGSRLGKRYLVGDRTEVAFRRPGERWRHGRLAVPTPGHLTLQPYRWQLRIPAGPPTELADPHLGPDMGRRPPLRLILVLNPQLRILDLTTAEGPLEVALFPSRIEPLRARIAGGDPS